MQAIGTELARQLRAFFALQGQSPELTLSGDVLTTVQAGNLDDPPHETKSGGSWGGILAAVAGNYSTFAIGLPVAASGQTMVLRRVVLSGPSGVWIAVGGFTDWTQVAGLAAQLSPRWRQGADQDGTVSQAPGDMRAGSSASDLTTLNPGQRAFYVQAPQRTPVVIDGPFVLEPGSYFVAHAGLQNFEVSGAFYWDVYQR